MNSCIKFKSFFSFAWTWNANLVIDLDQADRLIPPSIRVVGSWELHSFPTQLLQIRIDAFVHRTIARFALYE